MQYLDAPAAAIVADAERQVLLKKLNAKDFIAHLRCGAGAASNQPRLQDQKTHFLV